MTPGPRLLSPVLLAGVLLAAVSARARAEPTPGATSAPVPAVAEYVGGAACVECHEDEYEAWKGSHHDRAMEMATAETVDGDFSGKTFTYGGVTSRFFKRDGKFFVHTDGADGKLADFEIAYTFGFFPLQQYLVKFPAGRMQALGIAYDTRPAAEGGQRWFHLYPNEKVAHGDVLHWTGPAGDWNAMCADCHSTDLRKGYRPDVNGYDTRWSDIDVSCEACHGPGSRHVAWARLPEAERSARADRSLVPLKEKAVGIWSFSADSDIAHRSPPRTSHVEIDTCAPCHSRRTVIAIHTTPGEPFLDAYRPALLTEGLYFPDGQVEDEVYVYASFLQSKMYRAGVTCSDCHEPHGLRPIAAGNALCGRCHKPEKFDVPAHHHHEKGKKGAQCVECHMPTRTYMVIDARREHAFRVPRPDLSQKLGVPNACNGCHADKTVEWAAAAMTKWYGDVAARRPSFGPAIQAGRQVVAGAESQLVALAADPDAPGIARATAVSMLASYPSPGSGKAIERAARHPDALLRLAAAEVAETAAPGVGLRALVPLLDDPVLAVRIAAARSLASWPSDAIPAPARPSFARSLAEYRDAQLANADRPESHLNLGSLALALGDRKTARAAYERAIDIAPYFVPPYINLADLDRAEGRDDEGEKLLRRAVAIAPDNADVHHALGLLLVREKRMPAALEEFWRAAKADPDDPTYAYVYALALQATGRTEDALAVLRDSYARHSGHRETLLALATMSRDTGHRAAAAEYAAKLVALTPDDPAARQLLEQLSSGAGEASGRTTATPAGQTP